MSEQTVTVGRMVHYRLSEPDCRRIGEQRVLRYEGNTPYPGDVVPMIVVKVWSSDMVNGQVLLDGNDSMWATSVHIAATDDENGVWFWPPRA